MTKTKNGSGSKGASKGASKGKGADKARKPVTPNKGKGAGKASKPISKNWRAEVLAKPLPRVLVRILAFLAKSKRPQDRAAIGKGAPVDVPFLSTYLGADDQSVRAANEEKRQYIGLLNRGHVRIVQGRPQTDGGKAPRLYEITAAGKAALQKALKEQSGK